MSVDLNKENAIKRLLYTGISHGLEALFSSVKLYFMDR